MKIRFESLDGVKLSFDFIVGCIDGQTGSTKGDR